MQEVGASEIADEIEIETTNNDMAGKFTMATRSDTLSISMSDIVIPGSDIQKALAMSMKHEIPQELDDECVICMEGFTDENPRIPTLCDCGENKACFHLPCLYQWIAKSKNCPVCAAKIVWQEF